MADSDKEIQPLDETLPPTHGDGASDESERPTLDPTPSATPRPVASTELPEFEGYELVEELGRGGMGVVYKARSLKLDRMVALKMIIGGKFANEADVQRFRIEAESAARLDHPGIVPIYDIGEIGGNHFFTMKLVEGKSLSDEKEPFQSDPRKAAELMIAVANAVDHAHQRGVLHRDLKPANILIDSDGNPLVTDLGLAKRMEDESGLTQTGMAMGTPGFMPPEQAQGQRDITTAADVFSLGAILFWLQTGQPPFQRETAMQTLVATIQEETPSARTINPNASQDLDLICQKAMHRDPSRRYTSASALARDLQAWLNGDLISVRVPTAFDIASLWVKKNLRTLIGATISGAICGLLVGLLCDLEILRDVARDEHQLQQLGHSKSSWVSMITPARFIDEGWQALQFLIVPTIAVCAVLNVFLLRPTSREQNTVAAVTTGLTAGVVAFVIGLGWLPMREAAIERGAQDIQLLSSAVWLESDAERSLAQQALIQRYPGLEEMDQATRQQMTLTKIMHDQVVGILPGTWLGILLAVLFVVAPLVSTNVLSGVAWIEGYRGWHWFACTCERCVYCMLFFAIIALTIFPVPPAIYLVVPALAVMVIGLVVALKSESWFWRLAFGLATIVVMGVLNYDMAKVRWSASAAGLAETDAEFRVHAEKMNRLVANTHDPFIHYQVGIGWLSIGEQEEYVKHCRALLEQFENAFRPEIASRLAKISLLRPDLQKPSDLPTFYKLTELASSYESSPLRRWFFLSRALAEQRRGNPDAALEWTGRVRTDDEGSGYMLAASHAVDALAHLDLDDPEASRQSLSVARELRDVTREKSFSDSHDVAWVDWRVFGILESEIEQRLATEASR